MMLRFPGRRHLEHTQARPFAKRRQGILGKAWSQEAFEEQALQLADKRRVDLPVARNHTAKGRNRIGLDGWSQGQFRRGRGGDSARAGVLDHGDRRFLITLRGAPGCIQVKQIVV